LDENRDRLREKRKIETAAQEWSNQGRKKDYLLPGGQLKKVKAWQKGEGKQLGLSQLAEEFIKASQKYRQRALLLTAGWVTIPIFVAFLAVVPHLRQQRYDAALEKIKNPQQSGTKEALELLTEGCQVKYDRKQWWREDWTTRIPDYLLTPIFGKCYDLYGINLSGANLSDAKFTGVNLSDANLSGAKFTAANLSGAKFTAANLSGTKFISANLYGAELNFANLQNADLYGAKLNFANLQNTNLRNADLFEVDLRNANLWEADLRNANLWEADLRNADLIGANLAGAKLTGANLIGSALAGANLTGANLIGANLTGSKHTGANLKKAIYNRKTKLPDNFASIQNQMFLIAPGVDLSGADLSSINFESADFQGIDLTNANLEGSDLRFVKNLTPEQVKAAKNWEKAYYSGKFMKKLGLK
jgi:uncharacterized protein YjbI with pentapeptide repeats